MPRDLIKARAWAKAYAKTPVGVQKRQLWASSAKGIQSAIRAMRRHRATGKHRRTAFTSHLLRKYGLSYEAYGLLLQKQCGKCALCTVATPDIDVDHCHSSLVVRGLLCHGCNLALGYLNEDVSKAQLFAKNLEGYLC